METLSQGQKNDCGLLKHFQSLSVSVLIAKSYNKMQVEEGIGSWQGSSKDQGLKTVIRT